MIGTEIRSFAGRVGLAPATLKLVRMGMGHYWIESLATDALGAAVRRTSHIAPG